MNDRCKSAYGALLVLFGCSLAQGDEYYSSDLYRAIEQARISTHHYDYSRPLRYNRSTALSISLDPLLNQELSQTIIKAPVPVDVAQSPDIQSAKGRDPNEQPALSNKEHRVLTIPNSDQRVTIGTPNPVTVTVR